VEVVVVIVPGLYTRMNAHVVEEDRFYSWIGEEKAD
jgi:hypothetical protein